MDEKVWLHEFACLLWHTVPWFRKLDADASKQVAIIVHIDYSVVIALEIETKNLVYMYILIFFLKW